VLDSYASQWKWGNRTVNMARIIQLPFAVDKNGELYFKAEKKWRKWSDVASYIEKVRPTIRPSVKRKQKVIDKDNKTKYIGSK
jgi:hypothetical protein